MYNKIRRDIHEKYFYKYFVFSDYITDTCFRFMDYEPDYDDLLYDANEYIRYLLDDKIKDDLFYYKFQNKKYNTEYKYKDDIFYYKFKKYIRN